MAQHGVVLDNNSTYNLSTKDTTYNLSFGMSINRGDSPGGSGNYELLRNKPQINGVTLLGNVLLPDLGLRAVYYGTTQDWNSQVMLESEAGVVYIYSDYKTIIKDGQEVTIPSVKIGDGTSYLIDLPFVSEVNLDAISDLTDQLLDHINDATVHVTQAEKTFWNNKVTTQLMIDDPENLILTKL